MANLYIKKRLRAYHNLIDKEVNERPFALCIKNFQGPEVEWTTVAYINKAAASELIFFHLADLWDKEAEQMFKDLKS